MRTPTVTPRPTTRAARPTARLLASASRARTWLITVALLGAASAAAQAQTVTTVRVPVSATQEFSANACSAGAPRTVPDAPGALNVNSRLEVRVENDQNKPTPPGTALTIAVGKQTATLAKDASAVPITGDFSGETLTITRATDNVLVCSITVPRPSPNVPEDTGQRAFRVGIGASFDFLSGVSATDLYYDVTTFLPNAWSRHGRFGIDAGLYNGRNAARRDTIQNSTRTYYIDSPGDTTLVRRVTQRGTRRSDLTFDNLGLYISPTTRIGAGQFLVLHAEVLKRNTVTESVYAPSTADTTTVTRNPGTSTRFQPGSDTGRTTVRETNYEGYFGGGFLLRVPHRDVEFRVKPVVGIAVTGRENVGFFTVQFRVTDFEHGFKIGGEVRGPLRYRDPARGPDSTLDRNALPYRGTTLLVFLAKDFGFKRLAGFVLGGDED